MSKFQTRLLTRALNQGNSKDNNEIVGTLHIPNPLPSSTHKSKLDLSFSQSLSHPKPLPLQNHNHENNLLPPSSHDRIPYPSSQYSKQVHVAYLNSNKY
jgi:hypothetical protein